MRHLIFFCVALLQLNAWSQVKFENNWLNDPVQFKDQINREIEKIEVVSSIMPNNTGIWLENGYAKSVLIHTDHYTHQQKLMRPDSIQIIFTLYPKNVDKWYIMYHDLLSRRLKELFLLNPLLNDKRIIYSIILQDSCEIEQDAEQLYHGFQLIFPATFPLKSQNEASPDNEPSSDTLIFQPYEPQERFISEDSVAKYREVITELEQFNATEKTKDINDSTVYHVLENSQFDSVAAVVDWTGSMYHHGSQALLWHIYHLDHTYILGFTFFNDGNKTKDEKKIAGSTGGILSAETTEPNAVYKTMRYVHRKGKGGKQEENDVEALIYAQNEFPEAHALILIADNNSCYRDIEFLEDITKPVHIILPGNPPRINLMYIQLAASTGGTIRTNEGIVLDFAKSVPVEFVFNNAFYFRNEYGYYQTLDYQFCRICNPFYPVEKYTLKVKAAASEKAKDVL